MPHFPGGDRSTKPPIFSLNTILALLTLLGGVFLVTRPLLQSERPPSKPGELISGLSDQRVDARLWEDPLGAIEKAEGKLTTYGELLRQIYVARQEGGIRILPVVLSGGPFSEDQEGRIRSRFAVVSALGLAGYVPVDAQHVGIVRHAWPTTLGMEHLAQDLVEAAVDGPRAAANRLRILLTDPPLPASLCPTGALGLAFEWYRSRSFQPQRSTASRSSQVLVLWLDERLIADHPAFRTALLLGPMLGVTGESTQSPEPQGVRVGMIGPRTSATVRALIAELQPLEAGGRDRSPDPAVRAALSNVLGEVSLHLATASAMDEVLVTNRPMDSPDYNRPRHVVVDALKNGGFRDVRNLAATDSQLARQALDELELRRHAAAAVCFTNAHQHLVLLSEWDTFYGRMMSLTYAAELAVRQSGGGLTRQAYIAELLSGKRGPPTNLHSFVYLRGLDGQVAGQSGNGRVSDARAKRSGPGSLAELQITPAVNLPEGTDQFDYLQRLAHQLETLEDTLHAEGGHVAAVGIVGSDAYDVLTLLEAIRPSLPNAIYFTTELDARYWYPEHWKTARNLIVVSGYGLQLAEPLQQGVSAFRDSSQTAQMAAALAALGQTNLMAATGTEPRCFEVGRRGPLDLSPPTAGGLGNPHPVPPGLSQRPWPKARVGAGSVLVVLGVVLVSLLWRPLSRLSWERNDDLSEPLWLREEDVGGYAGMIKILGQAEAMNEGTPVRELFLEYQRKYTEYADWRALPAPTLEADGGGDRALQIQQEHVRIQALRAFLEFLNTWLLEAAQPTDESLQQARAHPWQAPWRWLRDLLGKGPVVKGLVRGRERVDATLSSLLPAPATEGSATGLGLGLGIAAAHARAASMAVHSSRWHRHVRVRWLLPALGALGLLGAWLLWHETYAKPDGEPASFLDGTSVWPTEIFRLLAAGLSLGFIFESRLRLRELASELTRRYRLSLLGCGDRTLRPAPAGMWFGRFVRPGRFGAAPTSRLTLRASQLWRSYQHYGGFWRQFGRTAVMVGLYLVFAFCLMQFGDLPSPPTRGTLAFKADQVVLWISILAFLFLTFWTMDAARLCRWFIEQLSESPTRYSEVTRDHFRRVRGLVDDFFLDEWIDVQFIADLTEKVGRLVWYPFVVFFVLVLSRHAWWDNWGWPVPLLIVFLLNLGLAAASVWILQRAALRAKAVSEASLETKVRLLESTVAPSAAQRDVGQARALLDEIRNLRRGAFVPVWENPILGALLVPSGGTVLLELLLSGFAR